MRRKKSKEKTQDKNMQWSLATLAKRLTLLLYIGKCDNGGPDLGPAAEALAEDMIRFQTLTGHVRHDMNTWVTEVNSSTALPINPLEIWADHTLNKSAEHPIFGTPHPLLSLPDPKSVITALLLSKVLRPEWPLRKAEKSALEIWPLLHETISIPVSKTLEGNNNQPRIIETPLGNIQRTVTGNFDPFHFLAMLEMPLLQLRRGPLWWEDYYFLAVGTGNTSPEQFNDILQSKERGYEAASTTFSQDLTSGHYFLNFAKKFNQLQAKNTLAVLCAILNRVIATHPTHNQLTDNSKEKLGLLRDFFKEQSKKEDTLAFHIRQTLKASLSNIDWGIHVTFTVIKSLLESPVRCIDDTIINANNAAQHVA